MTSAPCIFQEFRGVCPILTKHFFEKYTFAKSCWQVKHKKKKLVRHGVPGQCMSGRCNIDSNKIIGIGARFIIIIMIIIIIIIMIILFVHKDKKNNTHNDYRLPQALKHFLRDI